MYEFDLKTLWNKIRAKRKMILRNCGIAAVVAVVIGFSIPKTYLTNVELAAELQDDGALGGSAASLASLAGINLGGGTDAIGPNLYPNVVSSNKFIVGLLNTQVKKADGSFEGSYKQYLSTQQKVAWWGYPLVWLKKGIKAIRGKKPGKGGNGMIDPEQLTEEEDLLVTGVRSMIKCSVDESDGTITISALSQDPLVSKIMVDSATVKLQEFITHYRTNKARVDLRYYEKLEQESKNDYIKAQQSYADFCDTHREISSQYYVNKKESLENDLQLFFTAYSQMKQQVQMAKAKVQENTPAFTVVEAASVPIRPEAPKKKLILFAALFVTFMGSVGWIYFKLLFFTKEEQTASIASVD